MRLICTSNWAADSLVRITIYENPIFGQQVSCFLYVIIIFSNEESRNRWIGINPVIGDLVLCNEIPNFQHDLVWFWSLFAIEHVLLPHVISSTSKQTMQRYFFIKRQVIFEYKWKESKEKRKEEGKREGKERHMEVIRTLSKAEQFLGAQE